MSHRILVEFTHANGRTYTWSFHIQAFYSLLRAGNLPLDIEIIKKVTFPEGNAWQAPTMERKEMLRCLESMTRPYFEEGLS